MKNVIRVILLVALIFIASKVFKSDISKAQDKSMQIAKINLN